MRRIASKNTSPELIVRKLAHKLGYRFRLHRKDLPGKPDLVFPARKKVIFVHGCFWHHHTDPSCKISRIPKSRTDYWIPKLQRNMDRDKKNLHDLKELGWQYLVIWECEVKDIDKLTNILKSFLR